MESELKDILLCFKHETTVAHHHAYEDKEIDGDVQHVNQCIPNILVEMMEPGDRIDELKYRGSTPFYAWYRANQINSAAVETVAGIHPGTTTLRFKLVDASSYNEFLQDLVSPLFRGQHFVLNPDEL